MPGRWVGGPGSKACPVKDQYIEAKIFDEEGEEDGTVLLLIKRFYTPGEMGRFLLGDYLSASSKKFRAWVERRDSDFSVIDGSYHLCKTNPGECGAVSRQGPTVHLGKWRVWKEEEIVAGGLPEFDRAANALVVRYFKGHDKGRKPTDSALPWPAPGGGPKVKPGATDAHERKRKGKPAAAEAEEVPTATVTRLRKELSELKAALARAEGPKDAKAMKKDKKEKLRREKSAETRSRSGKRRRPFEGGGLARTAGGGDPGDEPPDWGGSEKDSDEEESDDDRSAEKPILPRETGRGKKRKKKDGGDSPSDDPDDDKDGSGGGSNRPKKKKKRKKKKQKEKEKKKRRELEKDKGPFGVAETRKVPKDDSSSGLVSDSDSDSSQSFRKAPSGLTLHLRLQRYAMKHPGRLASRLLQRMARATRFEGATSLTKRRDLEVPPCALTYFLTILTPTLKEKWTPRTQRELRVLVETLDKMAASEGATAADIIAQRIKALEQSVRDGNQWRKAKFLEIVDPEEVTLTDRGEANMMQKEVELEERLKGKAPRNPSGWEKGRKGKGEKGDRDPKGKGKGGGKNKNPSQEAAEKKEK